MYGQMNEPPGARASVALSGLTVAEGFRDGGGKDGQQQFLHHAATSQFAPELGHLEFHVHFLWNY